MKKSKVALMIALVVALLGLGVYSNASTDRNNDSSTVDENSEYEQPTTLPDTIDSEDDWYHPLTGYDVILNGEPVSNAFSIILDDGDFPTHVTLLPILDMLDTGVTVDNGVVTLDGMNGEVSFIIGEEDFEVAGETITLAHTSVELDGTIYVPIPFFRDIYGMGQSGWMCGHVIIDINADDMY